MWYFVYEDKFGIPKFLPDKSSLSMPDTLKTWLEFRQKLLQEMLGNLVSEYAQAYPNEYCAGHMVSTKKPRFDIAPSTFAFIGHAALYMSESSEMPDKPYYNDYWTPDEEVGIHRVVSCKKMVERFPDLIDRFITLENACDQLIAEASRLEQFWDENENYFKKVRWYAQRQQKPHMPILKRPVLRLPSIEIVIPAEIKPSWLDRTENCGSNRI